MILDDDKLRQSLLTYGTGGLVPGLSDYVKYKETPLDALVEEDSKRKAASQFGADMLGDLALEAGIGKGMGLAMKGLSIAAKPAIRGFRGRRWKPNKADAKAYADKLAAAAEKYKYIKDTGPIRKDSAISFYDPTLDKLVTGKVVKHSYGADKGQHTFTILDDAGNKIMRKGRNIYPRVTMHKPGKEAMDILIEQRGKEGAQAFAKRTSMVDKPEDDLIDELITATKKQNPQGIKPKPTIDKSEDQLLDELSDAMKKLNPTGKKPKIDYAANRKDFKVLKGGRSFTGETIADADKFGLRKRFNLKKAPRKMFLDDRAPWIKNNYDELLQIEKEIIKLGGSPKFSKFIKPDIDKIKDSKKVTEIGRVQDQLYQYKQRAINVLEKRMRKSKGLPTFDTTLLDDQPIDDSMQELMGYGRQGLTNIIDASMPYVNPNVGDAYSQTPDIIGDYVRENEIKKLQSRIDQLQKIRDLDINFSRNDDEMENLKSILRSRQWLK